MPVIKASANGDCACSTPHCVLRVSERPVSTLQEGVKFFVPLLALPPPTVVATPLFSVTSVALLTASDLSFYPQRFLRPDFGRAPPLVTL